MVMRGILNEALLREFSLQTKFPQQWFQECEIFVNAYKLQRLSIN